MTLPALQAKISIHLKDFSAIGTHAASDFAHPSSPFVGGENISVPSI
jgi:hypothetical protein